MDNLLLEKTIKEIEQLTPTQLNECYGDMIKYSENFL